jgi:hypothetical protein
LSISRSSIASNNTPPALLIASSSGRVFTSVSGRRLDGFGQQGRIGERSAGVSSRNNAAFTPSMPN